MSVGLLAARSGGCIMLSLRLGFHSMSLCQVVLGQYSLKSPVQPLTCAEHSLFILEKGYQEVPHTSAISGPLERSCSKEQDAAVGIFHQSPFSNVKEDTTLLLCISKVLFLLSFLFFSLYSTTSSSSHHLKYYTYLSTFLHLTDIQSLRERP